VLSQLAAGDLRANYIMTGATWRPFGSLVAARLLAVQFLLIR
jgi:hypothetical protein